MEIKAINLEPDSFIEDLSILHLEIETDDNKRQHCFLGIPKVYITDEERWTLEEWITKMHPFRNDATNHLIQKVLPKPDHGDNILFKKFEL